MLTMSVKLSPYKLRVIEYFWQLIHPFLPQIGAGVKAIQVREHENMESTCFYLLRTDVTDESFSIRKCICKLFPKWG